MTHADRKSPGWTQLLGLTMFCLAGCSQKETPKPPVAAKVPVAVSADASASLPQALDAAGEAKLADAYHAIRCVMVGAALPRETLYRDLGFDDGPAFAAAFSGQATHKPAWASKTIADSLAKPCNVGHSSQATSAAPTPTIAP